jgi:GNAT superfamily N-acetyltransferase
MSRTIQILELGEIEKLLSWAADEGWNPGLNDALAFQAADPNGFLGAFVDDVMIAAIAAVAYDDAFGFIGLYICHPNWRGRGHGKAVWDAGMAYLGERTIGLDAVPEQLDNYASMGFVASYDTIRMSGRRSCSPSASDNKAPTQFEITDGLDRQCFPANRDAFLHHWLTPPHQTLAHRIGDQVRAYAVLRPCIEGSKLGPLFATELDAALPVLNNLSGLIHIDVPDFQTDFLSALSALGFTPSFRTTRMYRGPAPAVRRPFVFGVTSLELG